MKSMTGFGRGTAAAGGISAAVELKTVNNRFLDLNFRMGGEMQSIEADLRRLVSERLSRGRVEVNLNFERSDEQKFDLNRPLIAGYIAALREIGETFGLSGEPDLNYIARLPNALQSPKTEVTDEFAATVRTAFEAALDELENMRRIEGKALKDELALRLDAIDGQIPEIESESSKVVGEYLERLNKKISDMLEKSDSQIEIDQGRLAQEVAYLAGRCDISEEITRLRSHLEQFRAIMDEESDVGKRLDFLTQELNREANTIASKTSNLSIKNASLTIKAEIEKIREQVQNVE